MLDLDKAFNFNSSPRNHSTESPEFSYDSSTFLNPSLYDTPPPRQQPRQIVQYIPNQQLKKDGIGRMLGWDVDVSGSQELCNLALFIFFAGAFMFVFDSVVKIASK